VSTTCPYPRRSINSSAHYTLDRSRIFLPGRAQDLSAPRYTWMTCFLLTIGRKFRLRLTVGLVGTSKQINKQPSDQIFLSINYHPILQHYTNSPNVMVIKSGRHHQKFYRNLSCVKQLIQAYSICNALMPTRIGSCRGSVTQFETERRCCLF